MFFWPVVTKSRLSKNSNSSGSSNHINDCDETQLSNGETQPPVLILPLVVQSYEYIGLLSESKVLSMGPIDTITNGLENLHLNNSVENLLPERECVEADSLAAANINSGQEKRTRFSHTHDEGSIGNTSDNLEAISEAASNHSVASSLELENEDQNDNDNLSDMVSANVSGRGTPNISGRDTPSSQVTEGEERRELEVRQVYLPPPQSLIGKQIRSEIDDKFCKFEIKKLLEGDETISIISDTWSTDVLASDSEIIEAHIPEQNLVEPVPGLLDVSETQSESAWSTDVLASDSERMTEVDTDDTASVARSDDTGRSEVDETPPITNMENAHQQQPINMQNALNPNIPILDNNRVYPQSPTVSYVFRPIRDDVPNSPSRSEFSHNHFNVTGRGGRKSDYRRRTVEYVDSNANNVVHNLVESTCTKITNTTINHSEIIERGILRTNHHNIENVSVRREAMLVDVSVTNNLQSFYPVSTKGETAGSSSTTSVRGNEEINNIGMVAISPAYLLANHVGAQKFIPKTTKMTDDTIRSSNASLSSMSSGSSSSSGSRNKTSNGITEMTVHSWNTETKQWQNGSENSLNITSTPSGSTSELSVLSPTNTQLSPVNNPVRNPSSMIKPSTSTGAIPKSISFDMTAEKGDKDLDEEKKNARGFFGKLRMGFRSRRGKSLRGMDGEIGSRFGDEPQDHRLRRITSTDSGIRTMSSAVSSSNETSEDILAKYRRKPSNTSDTNTTDSGASSVKSKSCIEIDDERMTIDPSNIENSFAFLDAKKKLRLVLSTSDVLLTPFETGRICTKQMNGQTINELIAFLQLQLAKARNLKDWNLVARISEALRCTRLFDDAGCLKLCHALKEDYCKRTPYNQYLLRCRQLLLSTLAHIEGLRLQIQSERELSNKCLVGVCVKLFLERQEQYVISFCEEFNQLKVPDEKTDLLDTFLRTLANEMEKDIIWQGKYIYGWSLLLLPLPSAEFTNSFLEMFQLPVRSK